MQHFAGISKIVMPKKEKHKNTKLTKTNKRDCISGKNYTSVLTSFHEIFKYRNVYTLLNPLLVS